ncbi:MAG TPA: cytochrome c [Balneolales bacterium]|nr:cytochrome c [Balneolales bacterium]
MRKILWWALSSLLVIVLLILLFVGGAYVFVGHQLNRTYTFKNRNLSIPSDSASIMHGRHVALVLSKCTDCHGEDLGGKVVVNDPAIGVFAGPNITTGTGSVVKNFTAADWDLAIRDGINKHGHPLIFMPSEEFTYLSNSDIADMIAYLRQVPPVDRTVPKTELSTMGRVLYTMGKLPKFPVLVINHQAVGNSVVDTRDLVAYGDYLAKTGGCIGCHGANFQGGHIPGTPPNYPQAANISMDPVKGIGKWGFDDFEHALRTGERPDGSRINPFMPWNATKQMTDREIDALWAYLKSRPVDKEFQ